MTESGIISDNEISLFAREAIRKVASKANFPKEIMMREIDGQIEFLIESSDTLATITFRPQQRIEEILRETEKWANEELKGVIPKEHFSAFVYQQMYRADEDVEIRALIEQFYSTFSVAVSKLDNGVKKLRSLVKKETDRVEKYSRPTEKAAVYMRFAEVVNQVKLLWNEV